MESAVGYLNHKMNEEGVSLIEVVASIVLLSIIILSVFYLLVQSSKTTVTSEEIVEATYIAQTEMEELFLSTSKTKIQDISVGELSKLNLRNNLNLSDYSFLHSTGNQYTYKEVRPDDNISIILSIEKNTTHPYENLTRVVIQVWQTKNGKNILRAQIENTIEWGWATK